MSKFKELKGKTIVKFSGLEKGSGGIHIYCSDGSSYQMFHDQDCCESVEVEDVCGDLNSIINSEILLAEQVTSEDENPDEILEHIEGKDFDHESFTWTFYKLVTQNGFITIRWYGCSNGYYSEEVTFIEI